MRAFMAMRLQRYLSRAGVASRRSSETLITAGRVRVNGEVVRELGSRVDERDVVEVDGKRIGLPCDDFTMILNKPIGYVTTMKDAHGRPTVADLIPIDEHPSLFPVGRLDMDTSGLLLFTTDGDLGNSLLHPSFHVDKRYIARVKGRPTEEELVFLRNGMMLDDGMTAPAKVRVIEIEGRKLDASESLVEIIIHEGRKRQVRRMLDAIGHEVLKLHRDSFGDIGLGNLKSGCWRELSEEEISLLRENGRR